MSALPLLTFRSGSYVAQVNQAFVWPPSARMASDATVSGAGSTAVNGQYVFDGTKWVKGAYVIEIPLGSPNWVLRSGATMFYVAPATDSPWEGVWAVGVGGTAPVPTVTETPS